MIPRSRAEKIIHFDDPVYSGQFSDDGNFFFACAQDFKVRMYNTSNPYNWEHYKTVSYPWGQWTLTDASLSPDNKWLAYTSIQSLVSIAPTDPNDTGDPYTLELDDGTRRGFRRGTFGIWSIRFSGDGRELVAGTSSSSVVVYDIESRTVLHNIQAHNDDVNAVCFADKRSPHILYSGSDDTTIKVWDRRCMGSTREVGAFVGHIEGLTYIDSKGDGRYILSNGKDQSMKLWDMRMAYGTDRFHEIDPSHEQISGFDYRGGTYDEEDWSPHPKDNSVVTFRGHKVLRTLIRCHFSPESSTNSRYVYSGSSDGKVYIWNLDATLAGTVDVKKATMGTRPVDQHSRFLHLDEPGGWGTCVRDASWHPNAPVLVGKFGRIIVVEQQLTIQQPLRGTGTTWHGERVRYTHSTRRWTMKASRRWDEVSMMFSSRTRTCTSRRIRSRRCCRNDFGHMYTMDSYLTRAFLNQAGKIL